MTRTWSAITLAACAASCGLALVYDFSGYPLLDPDEGRNAEIALEMAQSGDYVLPHLNGVPYLDKPILYFAAGAVTMTALGPSVTAARLPSLLFTLATIGVVFWFGRYLFDTSGGTTAAVATAATPFTIAYARTVIFDSTLTFFVLIALVAFYRAIERAAEGGDTRRGGGWWSVLAWAAMACGVLTKGPVALALPLMVVVPFAIWRRTWRALADWTSVLTFVAVVAPWLLAVSREIPDFLHYALVTETAKRLTTSELRRTGPLWYFVAILPAAVLPWSLVAVGSVRRLWDLSGNGGRMKARVVFLSLWIVAPLIFFSLSQSKRPQYVLPLVAAFGLLVAAAWHEPRRSRVFSGVGFAAPALGILGVFFIAVSGEIANWMSLRPAVAAAVPRTAIFLGAACILGGAGAWAARRHRELLLLTLSLPVAWIPVSATRLMDAVGTERSAAQMAQAIDAAGGEESTVIGVAVFPLSLPFYLRRPVILATEDGSELTSNYLLRHYATWADRTEFLRPAEWWRDRLLHCARTTFFVVSTDDVDRRRVLDSSVDLLMDTGRYAVYGPCRAAALASAR